MDLNVCVMGFIYVGIVVVDFVSVVCWGMV